ncbi:MAG: hypothetical protein WCJ29_06480 [bacterium]
MTPKLKLKVTYSIAEDAQNHMLAYKFTHLRHGRDDMEKRLRSGLNPKLAALIETASSEEECYKRIVKYIEGWHVEKPGQMEEWRAKLESTWAEVGTQVIANLEFLFRQPFKLDALTVRLSMIGICPYDFKPAEKWIYAFAPRGVKIQLRTITHELNHYMFYMYYEALRATMSYEDFELLKESITYFSNPEDIGKPAEKELREFYASRSWKNMDEAIAAGAKMLQEASGSGLKT